MRAAASESSSRGLNQWGRAIRQSNTLVGGWGRVNKVGTKRGGGVGFVICWMLDVRRVLRGGKDVGEVDISEIMAGLVVSKRTHMEEEVSCREHRCTNRQAEGKGRKKTCVRSWIWNITVDTATPRNWLANSND